MVEAVAADQAAGEKMGRRAVDGACFTAGFEQDQQPCGKVPGDGSGNSTATRKKADVRLNIGHIFSFYLSIFCFLPKSLLILNPNKLSQRNVIISLYSPPPPEGAGL